MTDGLTPYVILPNAPLFLGSGRGFSPSTSFWDVTLPLPTPSTLFGAFGRAIYENLGVKECDRSCREEILEKTPKFIPSIAEVSGDELENLYSGNDVKAKLYLPSPPIVRRGECISLPCLSESDRLLFSPKSPDWISLEQLVHLLKFRRLEGELDAIELGEALSFDDRVGIKLSADRTAEKGYFYRITLVSPRIDFDEERAFFPSFLAVNEGNQEIEDYMQVTLGGERRVAIVRKVEVEGLNDLVDLLARESRYYLLLTPGIYLETPCSFSELYTNRSFIGYSRASVLDRSSRKFPSKYSSVLSCRKTLPAPKGFKAYVRRWVSLPLTLWHRTQERVLLRAVSEGSVLVGDEVDRRPVSFAEEIGFGFTVSMEVCECCT